MRRNPKVLAVVGSIPPTHESALEESAEHHGSLWDAETDANQRPSASAFAVCDLGGHLEEASDPVRCTAQEICDDVAGPRSTSSSTPSYGSSLDSNGLPRIRTKPSHVPKQVSVSSCSRKFLGNVQARDALCADSPEYAESPGGDRLKPLHSVLAADRLQERQLQVHCLVVLNSTN